MGLNEAKLIEGLKSGCEESFTLLYTHYSQQLFDLSLKMLGSPMDAEDILQTTMVQAFQNIDRFREESQLSTWLYTITKNNCLAQLKKKKKNSFSSLDALIQQVQDPKSAASFTETEKNFYIEQVKEGCLMGTLQCLSYYQRMAFILNILMEVNIPSTAIILEKSQSATRTLVHRAKQNLKQFLCKNCSLYNQYNPCRCENLIDFSLKQGWIQHYSAAKTSKDKPSPAAEVENELNELRRMAQLYKSLPPHEINPEQVEKIKYYLKNTSGKIFSEQKVK